MQVDARNINTQHTEGVVTQESPGQLAEPIDSRAATTNTPASQPSTRDQRMPTSTTPVPAPPAAKAAERKIEQKWTKPLAAAGWTAIPNIIFERQQALGLDALDINLILHLAGYWWNPGTSPHPSVPTLAKALGVQDRTVQRRMKALVAAKLITKTERVGSRGGNLTNLYDFSGLITACKPFADEKVAQIAQRKAERAARLTRKKPLPLSVVAGGKA